MPNQSNKGCCGSFCLAYRQFNALCRKNAILKLRLWWQLLLELVIPIFFIVAIGSLKNLLKSTTVPSEIPQTSYPVPTMESLLDQTKYPNLMCFDFNMFYRCSCPYKTDESFYTMGSALVDPVENYWTSMHSDSPRYTKICAGLWGALPLYAAMPANQQCAFQQSVLVICNADLSAKLGVPPNCTLAQQPIQFDLGLIQNSSNYMIALGERLGLQTSIPQSKITSMCQKQVFALVPEQNNAQLKAAVDSFAQFIQTKYPELFQFVQIFESEASLNSLIKKGGYSRDSSITPLIGAAVVFFSSSPNWDYAVRLNATRQVGMGLYEQWTVATNVPKTDAFLKDFYSTPTSSGNKGVFPRPYNFQYMTSEALAIQLLVDEFIFKQEGVASKPPVYRLANFPYKSYTTSGFWSSIGFLFALFMVLALMYPVTNMIKALVQEKELKLKEGMKMMGLSPVAHVLSWWAHFVIFFLALSILMTAVSRNLFTYSDPSLIFWWYMLFNLSSISFSYFITSFFNSSKTASIFGAMLFFSSIFPYYAVTGTTSSVSSKLGACILPCTCFALGTDIFGHFEDANIGVTRDTAAVQAAGNLAFGQVLGMLVADWLIYGALAWYFNQVIPSEWGTHRKPWFLLTPSFWCPRRTGRHTIEQFRSQLLQKEESNGNPNVQPVSDDLKAQIEAGDCVAIRELGKTYSSSMGTKVAVSQLNLTFYRGQITALLGHNGAGKTTTISMLTGMIPITSGHAFVQGRDVGTEITTVRENMGVCPQHDILYPDLTVREHLWLFANFKGVRMSEVSAAVESMIIEVGLTEKRNVRAKNLSGGQKRKLSVGIAFIGNSKVVFLDEPTSGMDPYSRRFTWDVIRRNREGRVIVLTTHFMDEADLLGDRIAIMADGSLRCCGSSLFLKNKYGVGYNLTLVKKMRNSQEAAVVNPVHQEAYDVSKDVAMEVESVDSNTDNDGVKIMEAPHNPTVNSQSMCNEQAVVQLIAQFVPKHRLLSNVGAEMTFQLPQDSSTSFKAMLGTLDRQLKPLGVETYGISVTTLEEVFIRVAKGLHEEEAQAQLHSIRERKTSKTAIAEPMSDEWKKRRLGGASLFLVHIMVLLRKRFLSYKRDKYAWLFNVGAPVLFVLIGLGILQIQTDPTQPSHTLNLAGEYNSGVPAPQNPVFYSSYCAVSETCSAVGTVMNAMSAATAVPITFNPSLNNSLEYVVNTALLDTTKNYAATRYGAYSFWSWDVQNNTYEVAVHTNFTGVHSVPLFINALNTAMLKTLSGSPGKSITVREHPLPPTAYELTLNESDNGFTVVMFIVFAMAFVPSVFAQFIVAERESKTKHQQVVSGVSLNGYWLSSYIWDFLQYLFGPMLFIIILLAIFKCDILLGTHVGQGTFLLFLLYGLSLIPFTYLTTFFFKSAAMSTVLTILLNWIFGLLLMMLVFILVVIPSTAKLSKKVRFAMRIFPQYCFADGMLRIAFRPTFGLLDPTVGSNPSIFEYQMIGYDLCYMAWEGPIYFILVLLLERILAGSTPMAKKIDKLRIGMKNYKPSVTDLASVDEDVKEEEQRLLDGRGSSDVIQIHNLRKAFPNSVGTAGCKEAVKGITLGIPRGQCFGLLGINGAGKTTTLSILSGEIPPTSGSGTLAGLDIATQAEEVHKLVGYCPQFDAIFVKLTARENLQLYGQLKGIPADCLDGMVNETLKEMSLLEYADRLSGGFSGGNKRKLSVGIAMIGGPELIFLDEPSTGMDPVARRFMWDVITRISTQREQCAVILTTHSMEECEALCTRIGIMVGGRLRCLGAAQRLKSRFGLGYQLEIGLKLPDANDVSKYVELIMKTQGEGSTLIQVAGKNKIRNEGLTAVFTSFVSPDCPVESWREKFSEKGSASILYHELMLSGSVGIDDLASFICLEQRSMELERFVRSTFEGAVLRERQSSKARFEYPPQKLSLGNMFGVLEDNRASLGIEEYSLSQTTLEQIFNFFASQQEEETGAVAGMVDDSAQKKPFTLRGAAKVHALESEPQKV